MRDSFYSVVHVSYNETVPSERQGTHSPHRGKPDQCLLLGEWLQRGVRHWGGGCVTETVS